MFSSFTLKWTTKINKISTWKHARIPSLHWCFYIIPQFDNFRHFRHFRQGGGKMAVLSVLYFKNRQFWSGLIHFMNELIAHHTRQQTPLLCLVLSCFHWCVCLVTESFNWRMKNKKSTFKHFKFIIFQCFHHSPSNEQRKSTKSAHENMHGFLHFIDVFI